MSAKKLQSKFFSRQCRRKNFSQSFSSEIFCGKTLVKIFSRKMPGGKCYTPSIFATAMYEAVRRQPLARIVPSPPVAKTQKRRRWRDATFRFLPLILKFQL
jgi:hypothetical protein